MNIANTFPVFEPDQVLTNKHLNDMFNYLDEQDRITRCKLLGSGIVCGLEISHTASSISITKGCGLTTQGYIILFCDHTGNDSYKYYMPFTRPPFPKDLQLITQCGPDPDKKNVLFYEKPASLNNVIDEYLLLTQKDVDALTDKTGVNPITKINLEDYAVVLFLDVTETSLKNCDIADCNDKGSLMDFEIKSLLVNKSELQGSNAGGKSAFQPIDLRRYNVPAQNLTSSADVLKAFVTIVEALPLKTLAADLADSFTNYKSLLNGINTNPFGTEADFENMLLAVMKNFPYLVQYYYDFIYDLVKSLYEFRYRLHNMTTACCGDEMAFPFHLTLGEASVDTAVNGISAYRQYFIYSPLFDPQNGNRDEIRSLLMRMILMYQDCFFTKKISKKNGNLILPDSIRITPSTYGRNFISDRCIPYYYSPVADKGDAIQGNLYYYWNYDKTKRGNAKYNLGYSAEAYNQADSIVNPLVYDIEWYDFFRIEGHINQNINTVISEVKARQQNFNLPFDIVALSADYIGALVKGDEPKCSIQDLESDYRVIIAGFICTLHDGLCYAAKWPFIDPPPAIAGGLFAEAAAVADEAAATDKKTAKATPAASLDRLMADRVDVVVDHPFISGLVNEFQVAGSYVKGTTLQRLCSPFAGTMGRYYIDSVAKNNGKFVNPYPSGTAAVYFHLMEFIDSAEELFKMLMDNDLATLDTTAFKTACTRFEAETKALCRLTWDVLTKLNDNQAVRDAIFLLDSNEQMILHTCIAEKLEALKSEYLRRLAQFRLAKNFSYYFKRHGGIEHKSGVSRGGTFILVYHEERRSRFVDINSLYINKEIGRLMLSDFRTLLDPDTELDTLEAKAKMVAVSTLYKDPALYLQYKDVMQQYLDDCNDLPPDKKATITNIINQPPAGQITFELTDGAVIADFYVPYLCCSDCPPVAYILPAPQVVTPLDVKQGDPLCDAAGANFTTTLTVTGGTAPYGYSINNSAQTANNIITLPSGGPDATVIVTDAKGQTATTVIKSHTCAVQTPISVIQGDQICNDSATQFTVILTVTGGTAPYTYSINGTALADNKVTLPSGGPDTTVTIKDAAGQVTTTVIKSHTCQQQCNLPCAGLSENCKYVIWMSRPVDPKDSIKHTIGRATLVLTDEAGVITNLDVTAVFKFALDAKSPIKDAATFDDAFLELVKGLNDVVPANFIGGGKPMFTYDRDTQTMEIERFTCQTVVLDFTGVITTPQLNGDYHVTYDGAGALLKIGGVESELKVPKFDCIKIDKCKITSKPVCGKKPAIKNIDVELLPASGAFIFSVASPDTFDTWLWYFHDGRPMYATDEKPQINFPDNIKSTFVRVVAINAVTGCFAIMEQMVKIRQ